ncbi:hypothetical protein [Streptomyces sp. NPDC058735]|uniref:hypothetical protein n=1 Tax=unclassified Streptomyces TaxID=2593676 RepID=UPI0036833C19
MPRHEFQPGRLVAGLVLVTAAALYAGDAGGAWRTPWFVAFPLVAGGLFLAGAVALLTGRVRRGHRVRRASAERAGRDLAG